MLKSVFIKTKIKKVAGKYFFTTFADLNVPWCNGNTPVFGTVILGSSPSGTTQSS